MEQWRYLQSRLYEVRHVSENSREVQFSSWMILREDLHDSDFRTIKQHT